jgi:hypothetical protein
MAFEGRVILALQACKTVSGATQIMRITWDEAHGIMNRAVARGLLRREQVDMPHVAVDEKSHGRKKFVTILMDLDRGVVHGTAAGRSKQSLTTILKGLGSGQVSAIDAIAMDMHDPYREAVREFFPQPGPAQGEANSLVRLALANSYSAAGQSSRSPMLRAWCRPSQPSPQSWRTRSPARPIASAGIV